MNIYILVEGKTEKHVYPAWLSHLVPHLSKVDHHSEVVKNNFYLFSAQGYPSILDDLLNAVKDINELGTYDYLVVALDADEVEVETRIREVQEAIDDLEVKAELKVVVQNRCMESWFLGNRKIFKSNPEAKSSFKEFMEHYDVSREDPELMDKPGHFEESTSIYHEKYLKKMFEARAEGLRYSKNRPGPVCEPTYIEQLLRRISETGHLSTLDNFFSFCQTLKR